MMWTAEALAYLRKHWRTQSAAQIAKALGTTKSAVMGKVRRLGLSLPSNIPRQDGWSASDLAILRAHYGGYGSAKAIATVLGRSHNAVMMKAKELRRNHRRAPP